MAEALAHAQAVIVPSQSAEKQLRCNASFANHKSIQPTVQRSSDKIQAGEGEQLIVLSQGTRQLTRVTYNFVAQ